MHGANEITKHTPKWVHLFFLEGGRGVCGWSFFIFSKLLSRFLFTYDISTSLDPTNNMKFLNANYEPKAPISIPYILERKK